MVTIATFHEPAKAKHLKNRFQEAGVKADIHNEARLQMVAGGQPLANAKVMVEEEEFEKANILMHEWETNDPDIGAAIRCPQLRIATARVSAAHAKISHALAGQRDLRAQDFPEGILLPGLPLHLAWAGRRKHLATARDAHRRAGKIRNRG